ncbi:MAG: maleylacetoacetate isomerase [Polyangia bacterium]
MSSPVSMADPDPANPPSKTPILFHYWRSSSSWRVRWALHMKGIAFTPVAVDLLKGEQAQPGFTARSPLGLVPLLCIDGHDLSESLAILEYLEERFPARPLLPPATDALGRARVRQLALVVAADTQPLQNVSVLRHVGQLASAAPGAAPDAGPEAAKGWAQRYISRGLDAYEALLQQPGWPRGRFSYGDEVTVADLCLVPQLYNARRQGLDPARWPRLHAIEQEALRTEAGQRSAPDAYAPPT